MEELNETLVEEVVDNNETVVADKKSSKAFLIGGLVAIGAILFGFRKKISAKIDASMVKKLTKKGYSIYSPTDLSVISDDDAFTNVE